MKYDFLMKDAKKMCIEKYKDFLYVLKTQLCGIIQPKYVKNSFNHSSEVLGFMTEVGVLRRFYFGGLTIYQLNYSKELDIMNLRKITKDMVIRSAMRMEYFHSIGLKSFSDIIEFGTHGNNLSINNDKEVLDTLNASFESKGIIMDNFVSDENLRILYRLKANDIYIERVKLKEKTVRPFMIIYNLSVNKPMKMVKKILMAYNDISSVFTDYTAGTEAKPKITIHEFGDMDMFNMLVYDELLKHSELGCYDLESLKEIVIFKTYDIPSVSKYPYSNILN